MPTLQEERDRLLHELRALSDTAAERDNPDFTPEEQTKANELMAQVKSVVDQAKAAGRTQKVANDVAVFLDAAEAGTLNDAALGVKAMGQKRLKSLGELFVESDQFTEAFAKAATGGRRGTGTSKSIPQGTSFSMDPVHVDATLKALLQTGLAGGNGVGNLWDPERLPTVAATERALRMRDVVTIGTTDSDAVQFARVLRLGKGSTSNAAGVPEATTDAPVGSGTPAVTPVAAGVKPQSAIGFEKVTAPVVTIAHWIAATKKALSDAGQLRTLIDNFLREGLAREVERQVLVGDSDAGEEIDGILNTSGIQEQAFDRNILVTIRKALTKVSVYGAANAILMSPANVERIDLLQMATGQYYAGGPFGSGQTSVWRKPVIEVPALSDSQVLVGDFSTAVLFDREETVVTSTDSHMDFFTRNMVAILAECRVAFAVLDPALIVNCSVVGTDNMAAA